MKNGNTYFFYLLQKFCELMIHALSHCGDFQKDRVVQPTKIATFLAYKKERFCVIRNDCRRESGLNKWGHFWRVCVTAPQDAWSGSATAVTATRRRCCGHICEGEALHGVYSKRRHATITTPEKERLFIVLSRFSTGQIWR